MSIKFCNPRGDCHSVIHKVDEDGRVLKTFCVTTKESLIRNSMKQATKERPSKPSPTSVWAYDKWWNSKELSDKVTQDFKEKLNNG